MLTQVRTQDEDKYCLEPIYSVYLSSDVFTPDSLPRITQPNVGQQLVQLRDPKDTLGYHYLEYGGIGDAEILEEKHVNEPTFPRSHRHYKSGVKQRFLDIKSIEPHTLERWAQRDKACWIPKPGKNAYFLHEMFHKYCEKSETDEHHKNKSNIFPRAKQFELDYIIAQERAGQIQKSDQVDYFQTCDLITCGTHQEHLCSRRKYADHKPPDDEGMCDLYAQESQDVTKPSVGDSGYVCYKHCAPPGFHTESPCPKKDACFFKTARDRTVPDRGKVSVTGEEFVDPHHTEDNKARALCPVEPGRPCPDPDGILSREACFESLEKHRKMQLCKVGMPFRTQACRWYNQQFPNEVLPPVERPKKKIFPEMRFSNL